MRNHVLPSDPSHTYFMLPPTWLPAGPHRPDDSADSGQAKYGAAGESTAKLATVATSCQRAPDGGGVRRLGPLAPQGNERGHHRRAEKEPEKPHRLQPAEDAEQHQQEGQPRRAADQR